MYRCSVLKQNRLEYIISRFWKVLYTVIRIFIADKGDSKTYYVTNLRETKAFK